MRKSIILSAFLLIAISILLINCKKEDEVEELAPASMTAKIDGTAWSATQMDYALNGDKAVITGGIPQGVSIIISLSNFAVGTFELQQDEINGAGLIDGNTTYITNADPGAGGTVTISSINTTESVVSGTFNFIAHSPTKKGYITISEGKFVNIPISE